MNKKWEREFAARLDEARDSARFQLAKVVVEEGLKKGASIADMTRASERSQRRLTRGQIEDLIDLYGMNTGAGPAGVVVAGEKRVRHAIQQCDVDVTPEEVAEYAEEEGYTEPVAERLLKSERAGEMLVEKGLIRDDGKLLVSDPRHKQQHTEGETRFPKLTKPNAFQWAQGFSRRSAQLDDFLAFLKVTKQDSMRDPVVAPRLRRFAEQLERQADRFATGYEKTSAREQAKMARK